ncbi:TPA: colicin release lysis protein [Escherichia coli]|nr:colicin release lysis protein [Escherichia coli]
MKKLLFSSVIVVSMVLAACQVNNVRDTGGGAVSPSSTVTGIAFDRGSDSKP